MRKTIAVLVLLSLTSCATVLSGQKGPANSYQRTKPAPGQPERDLRVGFLCLDIALGVLPVVVDFATKKIYKEAPSN